MGSRCHYPGFPDRGGVRAHLPLPWKAANQTLHCQQNPAPARTVFLPSVGGSGFKKRKLVRGHVRRFICPVAGIRAPQKLGSAEVRVVCVPPRSFPEARQAI